MLPALIQVCLCISPAAHSAAITATVAKPTQIHRTEQPYSFMGIPSNPIRPGTTVKGRISYFGGPSDSTDSGHTASGGTTATPGIALYNRATLGGYWLVRAPNGRKAVVRQTDLGPAPWTGRSIDFTYSALGHFGYSQGNFPTDAVAQATYLGRSVPGNLQHLAQGQQQQPGSMPVQQGPSSFTSQTVDQAGYQAAQRRYLTGSFLSQTAANNPWGTTGGSSGLGSLFSAGALTTTPPNVQDFQHSQTFKVAHNSLQQMAGSTGLNVHPSTLSGGKYVNPIPHATIGRTDQGVDITMPVGAPIRAIGDSKLVQIQQNWYSGQPLYLYQLLSGPKKGQYYYVAEQFNGVGHPGQVFHAGETIGRYAASGTAIEIGWGSPTSGGRTLAQQQGNTGDSSHGNSPAGLNFRQFLSSLGA